MSAVQKVLPQAFLHACPLHLQVLSARKKQNVQFSISTHTPTRTRECDFSHTKSYGSWHLWGKPCGFIHCNVQIYDVYCGIYYIKITTSQIRNMGGEPLKACTSQQAVWWSMAFCMQKIISKFITLKLDTIKWETIYISPPIRWL
jgi:hypothetical protein